jgi:hypothetical protein
LIKKNEKIKKKRSYLRTRLTLPAVFSGWRTENAVHFEKEGIIEPYDAIVQQRGRDRQTGLTKYSRLTYLILPIKFFRILPFI